MNICIVRNNLRMCINMDREYCYTAAGLRFYCYTSADDCRGGPLGDLFESRASRLAARALHNSRTSMYVLSDSRHPEDSTSHHRAIDAQNITTKHILKQEAKNRSTPQPCTLFRKHRTHQPARAWILQRPHTITVCVEITQRCNT